MQKQPAVLPACPLYCQHALAGQKRCFQANIGMGSSCARQILMGKKRLCLDLRHKCFRDILKFRISTLNSMNENRADMTRERELTRRPDTFRLALAGDWLSALGRAFQTCCLKRSPTQIAASLGIRAAAPTGTLSIHAPMSVTTFTPIFIICSHSMRPS